MRTRLFLISCVAVLHIVGIAAAHDMWLAPEQFVLEKGELLTLRLLVGHGFGNAQEVPIRRAGTANLEMITPDGAIDLLEQMPESNQPAVRRRLNSDGIVVICMNQDHRDIELTPEIFAHYLEHEEYAGIESVRKKIAAKSKVRERYTRSLYCLLEVGGTANRYRQIQDDDLRFLEGMSHLQALDLYGAQITDAGLAHLSALRRLEFLNLGATRITDDGLSRLETLTNLRIVQLEDTATTGLGIAPLVAKLPKLQAIGLAGTEVAPAEATRLGKDLRLLPRESKTTEASLPLMQVLGRRIEIRLLQNPYLLKPGDELGVKVLLEGKPLKGQLVWAHNRSDGQSVMTLKARTNERGIVHFKLQRAGHWLLRLVHLVPRSRFTDVDWESYWATYIFKLN